MQRHTSPCPRLRGNHMYGYCDDAVTGAELDALSREVLRADYLGPHQLSDAFKGARGYSVVFTRAGIPALLAAMPGVAPYVRVALRPSCNAFYLNPLVIDDGGTIEAHVDCSLTPFVGDRVCPLLVSVLYLDVPARVGELVLTETADDGSQRHVRVSPLRNRLVLFRGDLQHEVMSGSSGARRSSLVCEQYRLADRQLSRTPTLRFSHGVTSDA